MKLFLIALLLASTTLLAGCVEIGVKASQYPETTLKNEYNTYHCKHIGHWTEDALWCYGEPKNVTS